MISAYRQLMTSDIDSPDNSLVLELLDMAKSKKALLMEQIDAEVVCLRNLVEVGSHFVATSAG